MFSDSNLLQPMNSELRTFLTDSDDLSLTDAVSSLQADASDVLGALELQRKHAGLDVPPEITDAIAQLEDDLGSLYEALNDRRNGS
jgi:hypothetical protein